VNSMTESSTNASEQNTNKNLTDPKQSVVSDRRDNAANDDSGKLENTSGLNGQDNRADPGFFGNISLTFRRGVGAVREWRSLQRQIQSEYVKVAKNEWAVQESLNEYRLVATNVSFKPQKLDQEIWSVYENLWKNTPVLKEKTRRMPLYLHRRQTLREVNASWEALSIQQKALLETLAKAPKSVEFYNRIHLARIKKHEHELREAEVAKRNAQAKESIEKVLSGMIHADGQGEIATVSSGILHLEDAQSFWRSRLQEISNMETGRNMDPDEIIQIYRNLEGTIRDAPRMAEQVKEVEVQFIRMMTMHEELSTYGKNIIPAEDLAHILILVQDEIPKLWVTGEWDKLRRTLNEVSSFLKFYDLPVRSELSLAERRKPGLARALLAGASNLPLSQITPVVRGLVSAIDARDKFMSGHSDAVAKVVVQIAKRMNWTGEDLEYIEIAALLHDVGKILIPENVLTKIDPLSPEDWKAIKAHPLFGAQIVKPIEPLSKIAPWIYSHQERWDGAGYPDRISDRDIPAAARIIAVGEAYTVMTTSQPKRPALSTDEAMSEITRGAGTQFDPEVAGALIQAVESSEHKPLQQNR
jgi:putative nucleotidyltransferase with HDIG domain